MPVKMEDNWVIINGIRTHYYRAGQGKQAIILLHGGIIDSAALSWSLTIPALACDYQVFALDWPGYGESEKPRLDYTIDFFVVFLRDFLMQIGVEKAIVMGISMGGAISIGFTLRFPEKVDKLILVDSYGFQDTIPWPLLSNMLVRMPLMNELTWTSLRINRSLLVSALCGIFYDREAITTELVDDIQRLLHKPGAERAFISCQRHEVTWDGPRTVYTPALDRIGVPTLIVHGREDRIVPLEAAKRAQSLIKDAQLHVIPECGHWAPREKPSQFNEIIQRFLHYPNP